MAETRCRYATRPCSSGLRTERYLGESVRVLVVVHDHGLAVPRGCHSGAPKVSSGTSYSSGFRGRVMAGEITSTTKSSLRNWTLALRR